MLNRENLKNHILSSLVVAGMAVFGVGSMEDSSPPVIGEIGQPIQAGDCEVLVTNVEAYGTLVRRGEFKFPSSKEAMYLSVQWSIKNTSNKPISAWSQPDLAILDPNGAEYKPDIDATVFFSSGRDDGSKTLSNLNPGIRVPGPTELYEVSKDLARKDGWKVKIKGEKTVIVPFTPRVPTGIF
jgi:hypothetical protein